MSRSSLYELLKRHPGIRTATSLERSEIQQQIGAAGGDINKAARQLGVSTRALRLQMKRLDMS